MKCMVFLSSVAVIISCYSCTNKGGTAKVICSDLEKFTSGVGVINIEQRSLGEVILLDTVTKAAYYLRRFNIPNSRIDVSTSRDSMVMLTSSKLQIQLSGDVNKASQKVKAEVETTITNNTTFYLSNCIRKSIHDPSVEVTINDQEMGNIYKRALGQNENVILAIVTSVLYADRFEFRLRNSSESSAGASIISVGDFKISVDYTCKNSLTIDAKQDGIFYKVSFFRLDKDNNLIFSTPKIDITEYSTVQNAL